MSCAEKVLDEVNVFWILERMKHDSKKWKVAYGHLAFITLTGNSSGSVKGIRLVQI